jgi:hypothetical protein
MQSSPYCKVSTLGACKVYECSFPADGGTVDAGSEAPLSAGTLSVTGTEVDGGVSLMPSDGGLYEFSTNSRLWADGALLTVSASGGTVPAFSQSITAPGAATVSAPACPQADCGSFSRTADVSVAWTGGGSVQANVSSSLFPGSSGQMTGTLMTATCTFTSSPGAIPAAVIAKAGAHSAGFSNFLSVFPATEIDFKAGDYPVTLTAQGGTGVSGSFDLSN